MKIKCKICGGEFSARPSMVKKGLSKYCSKKCYGISKQNRISVKCGTCKKNFNVEVGMIKKGYGKYCSMKCRGLSQRGKPSGMTGKKQSEYQKKIIGEIAKGNQHAKGNPANSGSFKKGDKAWNKGIPFSKEVRQKMSDNKQNEKNHGWKGDKAKKATIHDWVRTRKGRAGSYKCEICKEKQAIDWSNKDHKYKRNLDDYQAICRKCHREYDKVNKLR